MKLLGVLFLLCASGLAQTAAAPARKSLIIGNSAYTSLPGIPQTRANAELIADALRGVNFETELKLDLNQAGQVAAIRNFQAKIQPGDIIFFYYSGYALQGEEGDWLLATEFDPKSNARISRTAYLLSQLLEDLTAQSGPRMVVIDPVTDGSGLNKWAVNEGLAISAVKPQTLLCFSTQPGVAVKAQAGAGPGLFAKSLASALRVPGLLPIQVFERVQKQVLMESKQAQSPMFLPFVEDPFYFVPPAKIPAAVTAMQPGTKRENPKDGLDYVWIPPGTFKMGCVPADKNCAEDEKPQHEVKISHGFWITRTEITVGSYLRFADAEKLPPPKPTLTNPKWRYTAHPISKVNWADADAYCKWAGGSLPTEAQWEYAARGGAADQIYPWGNEFDPQLANTMNTRGSEKKKFPETLPVKYFLENPNKFGMFDVAGNVREWTLDTYDPRAYLAGPATDPRDVRDGKEKVARGGSFNGGPKDIRLSARDRLDPVKEATNQTGFRCILLDLK